MTVKDALTACNRYLKQWSVQGSNLRPPVSTDYTRSGLIPSRPFYIVGKSRFPYPNSRQKAFSNDNRTAIGVSRGISFRLWSEVGGRLVLVFAVALSACAKVEPQETPTAANDSTGIITWYGEDEVIRFRDSELGVVCYRRRSITALSCIAVKP